MVGRRCGTDGNIAEFVGRIGTEVGVGVEMPAGMFSSMDGMLIPSSNSAGSMTIGSLTRGSCGAGGGVVGFTIGRGFGSCVRMGPV